MTGVDDNSLTGRDRATTIAHSASGGGYNSVRISSLSVTVPDRENKLSITSAKSILESNQENYSVGGSCVSSGSHVDVSVGDVSATVNCGGNSWSARLDVSEVRGDNGPVTITASQSVGSEDSEVEVTVDRCFSSEDDSSPKWICSYSDLKELGHQRSRSSEAVYYNLGVDIDARDSWSEGDESCGAYNGTSIHQTSPCSGWEPLNIVGVFDGRGHSIENLYIHSSDIHVGLFGQSRIRISGLHLKMYESIQQPEDPKLEVLLQRITVILRIVP